MLPTAPLSDLYFIKCTSKQPAKQGLWVTDNHWRSNEKYFVLRPENDFKKVSGKYRFRWCFLINFNPYAMPGGTRFLHTGGFYSCSDVFNSTRCTASSAFCQLQVKLIFSDKDAGWFFVQPNIVSEQPKGDFLHLKTRKILQGFSITGLYMLLIKAASKWKHWTFRKDILLENGSCEKSKTLKP